LGNPPERVKKQAWRQGNNSRSDQAAEIKPGGEHGNGRAVGCRRRPRRSPQIEELPRNKWRGPSEAGEEAVYAGGYLRKSQEAKFDSGASLKGSDGGKSQFVVSAV